MPKYSLSLRNAESLNSRAYWEWIC